MPNHFHWMVKINELEVVSGAERRGSTEGFSQSEALGTTTPP